MTSVINNVVVYYETLLLTKGMPLSGIFKRASNFLLGTQCELQNTTPAYNDGEVVFCKNNVCVHPPSLLRQDTDIIHHPGYLTITCQSNNKDKPSLHLTWIPNTTLRRHPATIEQKILATPTRCERLVETCYRRQSADSVSLQDYSNRRSSSESYETQCSGCFTESTGSVSLSPDWPLTLSKYSSDDYKAPSLENSEKTSLDSVVSVETECSTKLSFIQLEESIQSANIITKGSSNTCAVLKHTYQATENNEINFNALVKNPMSPPTVDNKECENVPSNPLPVTVETSESNIAITCVDKEKTDVNNSVASDHSCYGGALKKNGYCKKEIPHNNKLLSLITKDEDGSIAPAWMISPELFALRHNLTFPESVTNSPVVRRAQRCCRKFSVDLSDMRSLRLFFSDLASTRGQLVVASRQCQYKILHFHHGGLERLASVLQQWSLLTVREASDDLPYKHFMVCRPAVNESDLHPEEGTVREVNEEDWNDMLNPVGQLEDDLPLRKAIFLGGLAPSLRKTVWPFLLHCYSFQSTAAEREHIQQIRRHEYHQITCRRLGLEGSARERFFRNIQCVVEKDVIRTDRANPYYAGESNPHVEIMKNILLNYAVYNASLGYTQGMSDLLAPVLAEIEDEADAFWCFVGLMQRGMFVCTPTDSDMERNLSYLRELMREMVPEFFAHLMKHTDATELLFCHRWILLCFKREFPEAVALRMWEACWSNYLTDYFHLFLCLAIVSAYADDVIAQDLRTDEMLLHFSSLAMFMDGDLILRKARGLLYKFRERPVIPCTLAGLCQLCGTGMWDSAHVPTVVCRGTGLCPQEPCPYRGLSNLSG